MLILRVQYIIWYLNKEGIKSNYGMEKVFALEVGGIVRTARGGECTTVLDATAAAAYSSINSYCT